MRDPRPEGLSRGQLGWLVWGAMASPLVRVVPGAALPRAGGGVWLSVLLALPGCGALGLLLGCVLSLQKPGEDLSGLLCRGLGVPGRILSGVCAGWLVFCGGYVIRYGADRFVAAVYPESGVWLFAGAALPLALPAGLGRVRVLGRCARAAAPALAGVFVLVFLFAAPKVRLSELRLPAGAAVRCGGGAVPVLGTACAAAFFLFLTGPVKNRRRSAFLPPLLGLSGLALSLAVTVTGVFGQGLAGQMDYPFFVLVRNVQLFHLLERMDALIAAVWVVSDFLLTGALLHMSTRALNAVLRGPGPVRRPWQVIVCAGAMGAAARLCAGDSFALGEPGRLIPMVDLFFALGVLPAALLIGRLRGKW